MATKDNTGTAQQVGQTAGATRNRNRNRSRASQGGKGLGLGRAVSGASGPYHGERLRGFIEGMQHAELMFRRQGITTGRTASRSRNR